MLPKPGEKKFLFSGFVLCLLLIIGVQLASYKNSLRLIRSTNQLSNIYRVKEKLERMSSVIRDLRYAHRSFIITGKKEFIDKFYFEQKQYERLYAEVSSMLQNDAQQLRKLKNVDVFVQHKIAYNKKTIERRDSAGIDAALPMLLSDSGNIYMSQILSGIYDIGLVQSELIVTQRNDLQHSSTNTTLYNLAAILVGIVVLALIYMQLNRQIRQISLDEMQIRSLNAELLDRIENLALINKDLKSFSMAISRDLKSPIHSIEELVNTIERTQLAKPAHHETLELIRNKAQKVNYLIEDLLSYSNVSSKPLKTEHVEMNAVVGQVKSELLKTLPYKAPVFIVETLPGTWADRALIKQVFTHLLANAIKFSSKQRNPLVRVWAERINGSQWFHIKDNGAGFDMNNSDKLFEAFSRLHQSTEFEGNGLGLALAERIIHKHGGVLKAESEPGKGAVFSFSIPTDLGADYRLNNNNL